MNEKGQMVSVACPWGRGLRRREPEPIRMGGVKWHLAVAGLAWLFKVARAAEKTRRLEHAFDGFAASLLRQIRVWRRITDTPDHRRVPAQNKSADYRPHGSRPPNSG